MEFRFMVRIPKNAPLVVECEKNSKGINGKPACDCPVIKMYVIKISPLGREVSGEGNLLFGSMKLD